MLESAVWATIRRGTRVVETPDTGTDPDAGQAAATARRPAQADALRQEAERLRRLAQELLDKARGRDDAARKLEGR